MRQGEWAVGEWAVSWPGLIVQEGLRADRAIRPRRRRGIFCVLRLKRRLYERAGVSEYWVVDPIMDAIRVYTVYTRENDRFGKPLELSRAAGYILSTPLLPQASSCRSRACFGSR